MLHLIALPLMADLMLPDPLQPLGCALVQ